MGTRGFSSGKLQLTVQGTITNTLTDGAVASQVIGGTTLLNTTLTNGVGASMANRGWQSVSRTLASGEWEVIDFYDFAAVDIGAGAGKDGLGQACAFEEIVALVIKHVSGAGRLEIQKGNPIDYLTWMPAQTVANGGALRAGGCRVFVETDTDGLDIQDGVSHRVRFDATGGSVVYSLYILAKHDDSESSSSSSSTASTPSSSTSSSSKSTSSKSTSTKSSSSTKSSLISSQSASTASTESTASSPSSLTPSSASTLSTLSTASTASTASSASSVSTPSSTG